MTKLNPNLTTLNTLINKEGHGYRGATNVGEGHFSMFMWAILFNIY